MIHRYKSGNFIFTPHQIEIVASILLNLWHSLIEVNKSTKPESLKIPMYSIVEIFRIGGYFFASLLGETAIPELREAQLRALTDEITKVPSKQSTSSSSSLISSLSAPLNTEGLSSEQVLTRIAADILIQTSTIMKPASNTHAQGLRTSVIVAFISGVIEMVRYSCYYIPTHTVSSSFPPLRERLLPPEAAVTVLRHFFPHLYNLAFNKFVLIQRFSLSCWSTIVELCPAAAFSYLIKHRNLTALIIGDMDDDDSDINDTTVGEDREESQTMDYLELAYVMFPSIFASLERINTIDEQEKNNVSSGKGASLEYTDY